MQLSTGLELLGLAVLFLGASLGISMAWQGVQDPMATESSGKGATQEPKVKLAVEVEVEEGNIFVVDGEGERTQLTCYGLDRDPSLSPDGGQVVFVRETPGRQFDLGPVDGKSYFVTACEIWVAQIDGAESRRLVEGWLRNESPRGEFQSFFDFTSPLFKSGGKKVVFTSHCAVTTRVVYEVDLRDLSVRFLIYGNTLEVILGGKYQDHLLIQRHGYWLGGGSYDWYWLVSPDGRAVDPIGPDPKNFRQSYMTAE